MIANLIAEHADFFSFGTNDLTQAGIGLSRDDVEAQIIPRYIEDKILDRSPFQTLDAPGIGELVRIAAERGRRSGCRSRASRQHRRRSAGPWRKTCVSPNRPVTPLLPGLSYNSAVPHFVGGPHA